MNRILPIILAAAMLLGGCGQAAGGSDATPTPTSSAAQSGSHASASEGEKAVEVTDANGELLQIEGIPRRVVALSSSLAEIWLLAGGELSGVTGDALTERELGLSEGIAVVGSVMEPSTEAVLALAPELVILSPDLARHQALAELLRQNKTPFYAAKADTLEDYLKVLRDFTALTEQPARYVESGEAVQAQVQELLADVPEGTPPSALFLRAYSSGVKVKARDHIVCDILDAVGVGNVAEGNPALEELGMEAIRAADPDFIFVVTMGADAQAAEQMLNQLLTSNPAWQGLTAVQNDRVLLLPKELFHLKPNNRWGDAYAYILALLWPDTFGAQ